MVQIPRARCRHIRPRAPVAAGPRRHPHPLRRVGLRDTFAEGALTGPYLFSKYGLSTQAIVDTAWTAVGRSEPAPVAEISPADPGEYSPV